MCKEKTITYNRTTQRGRLSVRDIPESEWCDFRRDYESGMTFKEIAKKYCCDPRTVKSCIRDNKPSSRLGEQTEPTKIAGFTDHIDAQYWQIISEKKNSSKKVGICEISRIITDEIWKKGYTGGERTVRDYLRKKFRTVERSKDSTEE